MKILWAINFILLGASFLYGEGYYIEAETIQPSGDWIIASTTPGYTGNGYLVFTGKGNRNQNDKMTWEFNITTPGNYWIQLRCRRDQEFECPENPAEDLCNDIFSKVNNGSWEKTMIKRAQYGDDDGGYGDWGNWFWDGRRKDIGSPIFMLKAGKNTYSISSRSPATKVDAIAVFQKNTARPKPENSSTGSILKRSTPLP